MGLLKTGEITAEPRTEFFWDADSHATIEATELDSNLHLIRASKSFRLVKQDKEGQESWDANLRNLNDYLAEKFSFEISVNYVNEATPEVNGSKAALEEAKSEAEDLLAEKKRLQQESTQLSQASERGSELFQKTAKQKARSAQQQLENTEQRIDRLIQHIDRERRKAGEWRENGVSLAYLFTISTSPEIVSTGLTQAVENHLEDVESYHRDTVRQVLEKDRFKLAVEEVKEPRIFNRVQYVSLLHPDNLNELIEENPDLEQELKQVRNETVAQYEAFALKDLEVDGRVFERSKATPAQAVNGLLQSLETQNIASSHTAPNDGPYVGNVAGTEQVVGFDPAEYFDHIYIAGKTGSGKTYLKRVLMENAASLGYNCLSVVPTDRQGIAASFANPDHEDGRGLNTDQYLPGDDRLLDWPRDVSTLLEGVNTLTLTEVDQEERQSPLVALLEEVYSSEFSVDEPLFLFVEEAQTLNGEAKQLLKQIVKEKRKHNIHCVLVTQNPMQFKRQYADIRRNTSTVFLHGEYFSYADDFDFLESKREVSKLGRAQAILHSLDLPKVTVDVRRPVSRVEEPTEAMIDRLDQRYWADTVDLGGGGPQVSIDSEQDELMEWIRQWLAENPEYDYITASKCWRPSGAPGRSNTVNDKLNELVEAGLLEKAEITRNHNLTEGFRLAEDL